VLVGLDTLGCYAQCCYTGVLWRSSGECVLYSQGSRRRWKKERRKITKEESLCATPDASDQPYRAQKPALRLPARWPRIFFFSYTARRQKWDVRNFTELTVLLFWQCRRIPEESRVVLEYLMPHGRAGSLVVGDDGFSRVLFPAVAYYNWHTQGKAAVQLYLRTDAQCG